MSKTKPIHRVSDKLEKNFMHRFFTALSILQKLDIKRIWPLFRTSVEFIRQNL